MPPQSVKFLLLAGLALAQAASTPIVQKCPGLSNASNVACVNNYAAVLPYPFLRSTASNGSDPANDTFIDTAVTSDTSFDLLQNASFVVFEQKRGLSILGSAPKLERIFDTRNDSIHEAPVYVPGLNAIIFSLPHIGVYSQQIINLNNTPPTIENYTTSPPTYAVNGGKYYNGKIYWAVEASFPFPNPANGSIVHQYPGIYELDPWSREVRPLVNNYYGQQLNSPNDLYIDSRGDIFFSDSWYGYAINVTQYPVLNPNTYRFRPSTGALQIVENSIAQPNGVGISPDGRTVYITDTGITNFDNVDPNILPRYTFDPFGGRAVYAFDVNFSPPGNYLTGKRPIYLAETFADDGFHVSREGFLLGAAGTSIDILGPFGEMILKVEIGGEINNLQFAPGADGEDLWAFGPSGIWRITGLHGLTGMREE